MLGDGFVGSRFRANRALFNIIFTPYHLLLFCFFPFVVGLDLIFQKADILFVNQKVLKERGTTENSIFAFFRSQIHLKIQRMVVYHWIQLFYLATLFLVVQNPNKESPYLKCVWYNMGIARKARGGVKACQDDLGHFFSRVCPGVQWLTRMV